MSWGEQELSKAAAERKMRQVRDMIYSKFFGRNKGVQALPATEIQRFNAILSPDAKKLSIFVVLALGVRLLINFYQPIDAVVHINLRGSEVGVAEQFLDGVQVGTAVGEVRGEGVAQHMRAALLHRRHGGKMFVDDGVDVLS